MPRLFDVDCRAVICAIIDARIYARRGGAAAEGLCAYALLRLKTRATRCSRHARQRVPYAAVRTQARASVYSDGMLRDEC